MDITNSFLKKTKNKAIQYNSAIIACLILSNLIANTIYIFLKLPNIFPATILLLFVSSIVMTGIMFKKRVAILVIAIFIQFLLSLLVIQSNATTEFLFAFASIVIPSMFIASKPFDIKKVLKAIQIIGLICSPYVFYIIYTDFTIYDSGSLMGIGYSVLPVIISSLIIIFGEYNKKTKYLSFFNLITITIASAKFISRGYFVSVLACIIILCLFKFKQKAYSTLKVSILVFIAIVPLALLFSQPIKSSQLYYNLFELKSNDVLNGRTSDLSNLQQHRPINEIIFGSGIGSYYKNHNALYIHNIFGMTYYELGIFYTLAIFLLVSRFIVSLFRNIKEKDRIIILFLLCTSIIRLFVSYTFWFDQIFWIFVAYYISQIAYKTNNYSGNEEVSLA
jgi:hypothetical protein